MKKYLFILSALILMSGVALAKSERRTVVFDVPIHCQACIDKIERNIAFERGVKDLVCDLKKRQVTVVYDPQKTDIPVLQEAFEKIGKPATVHQSDKDDKPRGGDSKKGSVTDVDAQSGASVPMGDN